MKKIVYSIFFLQPIFEIFAKIFRLAAFTGKGSDTCLKYGFLPLPVNYYSPVPDIEDLIQRDVWNKRYSLEGIDFRIDQQIEKLKYLGSRYADECRWEFNPIEDSSDFYLNNQSFGYGCAASTHAMVRDRKPGTVIEIGSGMSSRILAKALALNCGESRSPSRYIIIDPYPDNVLIKSLENVTECIEKRVETLEKSLFAGLQKNDILFIDSGHVVRIGGDVNFLILEILPLLSRGVIVHFHDISLPYEYPKIYTVNSTFRQFWTEQYLLHSFLCFNTEFEILLAMNYLMTDHKSIFLQSFPHYKEDRNQSVSGSFWIRKKL